MRRRMYPTLVWFKLSRVPAIALAKKLVTRKTGQIYHYRATYLQSWGADPSVGCMEIQAVLKLALTMGDLLSHSIDLALM